MKHKNQKPVVSVIIPNYNHAPFLKQRIDSVLSQTFEDFEIIILDDYSTDDSREIIEQYRKHPKVTRIVYNEINSGGVFKQWVKGIEMAEGKYIWIAESDDYADEKFLEEAVKTLKKNPFAGMVFTDTTVVDAEGKILAVTSETKRTAYPQLADSGNIINSDNGGPFLVSEMVIENASSAVFRKSALMEIDFNPLAKYSNTGDRFVYIGIALNSDIIFLPQRLNFMRSHEHNTTRKNSENGNLHRDRLAVMLYYFDHLVTSSLNRQHVRKFYKNNYLYFMTHGSYEANRVLLEKLNAIEGLSKISFYFLSGYIYLLNKTQHQSGILRSLYYRMLLQLHHFNKDYQK